MFNKAESETLWLSHIEIWDGHFMNEFSLFFYCNGWMYYRDVFMLLFTYSVV